MRRNRAAPNAVLLLDTNQQTFDMLTIGNRRFMFCPETGELVLGAEDDGGRKIVSSHAEEHAQAGTKTPFDRFIRGWVGGTHKDYPGGVIHFAPHIPCDGPVDRFEAAFAVIQMFKENGATETTLIRGFGREWEQPLSALLSTTV